MTYIPEVVGRLCTPSEEMKAVKAYRKESWVDDLVGKEPREPGFYTVEDLIRITDYETKCRELVNALELYEQPLRVAIKMLNRTGNPTAQEIADELREVLGNAYIVLDQHKK